MGDSDRGKGLSSASVRIRTEGGVAEIALQRPPVNVLGPEELALLCDGIQAARGARVLLISGLKSAFSAGVEVAEHAPEPARIERMLAAMREVLQALVEAPAATIAAVRGACLGGAAEIVAACDLVVAAEDARIGFPEIRLACFPPAAPALLPLRVGVGRAADWILTGRILSGREALEAGFVSRCVADDRVGPEVERLAAELLSHGPAALAAAVDQIRRSRRRALAEDLPAAEDAYRRLAGDQDLARAVREFGSRRS